MQKMVRLRKRKKGKMRVVGLEVLNQKSKPLRSIYNNLPYKNKCNNKL
jgi:hypothetical protein